MSYPDPAGRELAGTTVAPTLTEGVARRQGDAAAAAAAAARDVDPQAWLFEQRARYIATGTCDPYAEQTLRLAGLLTIPA